MSSLASNAEHSRPLSGQVVAVARSSTHSFRKETVDEIRLLAGLGVEGDAHCGSTVRHRSRVAVNPTLPNLRQVHLLQSELHEQLQSRGLDVGPGQMGENITTRGIDLLTLPVGTLLQIGAEVSIEVTGLRNPCVQLDGFRPGLMAAVLDRDEEGRLLRKAGIMGVVRSGGVVKPQDPIRIELPAPPHRRLEPV